MQKRIKVNCKVNGKMNWKKLAEEHIKEILLLIKTSHQWSQAFFQKSSKEKVKTVRPKSLVPTVLLKSDSWIDWHVGIKFVGTVQMKQLNKIYRKSHSVTDILSFTFPQIFYERGFLGELVICLPQMRAQAKTFGHPPAIECALLIVHGILHLLGFDHEKNLKQAKIMADWERRILKKLQDSGYLKPFFLKVTHDLTKKRLGLIDRTGFDIK